MMKVLGIILLVAGLLISSLTVLNAFNKKRLNRFVSMETSSNESALGLWSPVTGSGLVFIGVFVLFVNNKERHPMERMIKRK